MTGFSGIEGKAVTRQGGKRYSVDWPARFFLPDKVIHRIKIDSVFKGGYSFTYPEALPLNAIINIETLVTYRNKPTKLRLKAKVVYCLLKSNGDGSEVDVVTTQIEHSDQHMVNNILQNLGEQNQY